MTLDDRLRKASEETRASFDGRRIPDLNKQSVRPATGVTLAVLVIVLVVSASIAVARRDERSSQVTANAGDRSSAGRLQEPTTAPTASSSTVPTAPPNIRTGDASLLDLGPLSPRGGHSVVWSGRQVIVWGGWGDESGRVKHADGAAYDPATAQWRKVAAAPLEPRRNHAAAWSGNEMLVVGGDGRTDGAAYDPLADSWRRLPPTPFSVGGSESLEDEGRVATGDALYIWNVTHDRLARYDFARDRWDEQSGPGFGSVNAGALRMVGERLVAIATTSHTGSRFLVATLDPAAASWARLPDGEFARDGTVPDVDPKWSAAVDDILIIWSQSRPDAVLALNPDNGSWQPRSPHPLPSCESAPPPQVIDGGFLASSCGATAQYRASEDLWKRLDLGELTLRERETVWTGSRIVSWGDTCCYGTGGAPFTTNLAWSYPTKP